MAEHAEQTKRVEHAPPRFDLGGVTLDRTGEPHRHAVAMASAILAGDTNKIDKLMPQCKSTAYKPYYAPFSEREATQMIVAALELGSRAATNGAAAALSYPYFPCDPDRLMVAALRARSWSGMDIIGQASRTAGDIARASPGRARSSRGNREVVEVRAQPRHLIAAGFVRADCHGADADAVMASACVQRAMARAELTEESAMCAVALYSRAAAADWMVRATGRRDPTEVLPMLFEQHPEFGDELAARLPMFPAGAGCDSADVCRKCEGAACAKCGVCATRCRHDYPRPLSCTNTQVFRESVWRLVEWARLIRLGGRPLPVAAEWPHLVARVMPSALRHCARTNGISDLLRYARWLDREEAGLHAADSDGADSGDDAAAPPPADDAPMEAPGAFVCRLLAVAPQAAVGTTAAEVEAARAWIAANRAGVGRKTKSAVRRRAGGATALA